MSANNAECGVNIILIKRLSCNLHYSNVTNTLFCIITRASYIVISLSVMDAKVDDFFNEINQIAPPKRDKHEDKKDWKECYDDRSGHTYFWNMKTNEVTWDTPSDYRGPSRKKKINTFASAPLPTYLPTKAKIYSLKDTLHNKESKRQGIKKFRKPSSDSEDEKIELITSYGSDSDSEPDVKKSKSNQSTPNKIVDDSYGSDGEDGDILQKIQKRVQELKQESDAGKVPPTIGNKDSVTSNTKNELPAQTGISLIAGYSDSEDETDEPKHVLPVKAEETPVAHSTLFPITTPVEIKDFTVKSSNAVEPIKEEDKEFDNKAFKRKRRIGISLVNTEKKKMDNDNERRGLGFGKDSPVSTNKDNVYSNFTKGGVMFVKADTLNAVPDMTDSEENKEETVINKDEVNDMYSTLKEKLAFLNVGSPEITPVQIMLIQAEMLFVAMEEGGLKLSYLQKWLSETCSELIKLEKAATPESWQLQWDRQHKRYYYRNEVTGACQWEYPTGQATPGEESTSDSDAMDICTTPPPEEVSSPTPPSPPQISCFSVTPPPPPLITDSEVVEERIVSYDVPLPEPMSDKKIVTVDLPLPPGVDPPEEPAHKPEVKELNPNDPLNSVLNSFYCDIAAISTDTTTSDLPPPPSPTAEPRDQTAAPPVVIKKKKKSKVKLAAGLTMKKKGVVQLVEKWKNVQNNY